MPWKRQAERDIVARRLPRQQRVVLEQDADLGAGEPGSTMPASGCCSPITARSRLDLPEPEGPTRLTNWPSPTERARSFEDRLAAIGDRQIADAQLSAPTIVVSCRPDMLAPGLSRPPAMRLCSTRLAAFEVDGSVSG